MCRYSNLNAKREIDALIAIKEAHDKMLKEANQDVTLTSSVKLIITSYHRQLRDEAQSKIDKLKKIPDHIKQLITHEKPEQIRAH